MPGIDIRSRVHPLVLAAGLLSASAAVAADDGVPQREPGLWRLTTISAVTGMSSADVCIAAGDSMVIPSDGRTCSAPKVERAHDQVIVNLFCKTSQGEERMSTLFTGDFKTWYRAITKITYDPPFGGISNLGVTVDARYLSASCSQERPATGVPRSGSD